MAAKLASGPTRVLGLTRPLLWGCNVAEMKAHIRQERRAQESALRFPYCVEGVQAFLAKRNPEFSGGKP